MFSGCVPSCQVDSGNRTGYTVSVDSASTVDGLGEVSCTNGYGRVATSDSARVECPVPGGTFVFRGCEATQDCVGAWSICALDCRNRTFSVLQKLTGEGQPCSAVDGASAQCLPGDGQCPASCTGLSPPPNGHLGQCSSNMLHGDTCALACDVDFTMTGMQPVCLDGVIVSTAACAPNVDCVGAWSTCIPGATNPRECPPKVFAVAIPQSGSGAACAAPNGTTAICFAGEGYCPVDEQVRRVNVSIPGIVALEGAASRAEVAAAFLAQTTESLGNARATVEVKVTSFVQEVSASLSLPGSVSDFDVATSKGQASQMQFVKGVADTLTVSIESVQFQRISAARRRLQLSGLLNIEYGAVTANDVSVIMSDRTFTAQLANGINQAGSSMASLLVTDLITAVPAFKTTATYTIVIIAETSNQNSTASVSELLPELSQVIAAASSGESITTQINRQQLSTRGTPSVTGAVANASIPLVSNAPPLVTLAPASLVPLADVVSESRPSPIAILAGVGAALCTLCVLGAMWCRSAVRRRRQLQEKIKSSDYQYSLGHGVTGTRSGSPPRPSAHYNFDSNGQPIFDFMDNSDEERDGTSAASSASKLDQAKRLRALLALQTDGNGGLKTPPMVELAPKAPDSMLMAYNLSPHNAEETKLEQAKRLRALLSFTEAGSAARATTPQRGVGDHGGSSSTAPTGSATKLAQAKRLRDLLGQSASENKQTLEVFAPTPPNAKNHGTGTSPRPVVASGAVPGKPQSKLQQARRLRDLMYAAAIGVDCDTAKPDMGGLAMAVEAAECGQNDRRFTTPPRQQRGSTGADFAARAPPQSPLEQAKRMQALVRQACKDTAFVGKGTQLQKAKRMQELLRQVSADGDIVRQVSQDEVARLQLQGTANPPPPNTTAPLQILRTPRATTPPRPQLEKAKRIQALLVSSSSSNSNNSSGQQQQQQRAPTLEQQNSAGATTPLAALRPSPSHRHFSNLSTSSADELQHRPRTPTPERRRILAGPQGDELIEAVFTAGTPIGLRFSRQQAVVASTGDSNGVLVRASGG